MSYIVFFSVDIDQVFFSTLSKVTFPRKGSFPLRAWNEVFFVLLIFLLRLSAERRKKNNKINNFHVRSGNEP